MLTTRFTELVGCRLPLQQAGMGGVAKADLAAAVSATGDYVDVISRAR